MNATTSSVTLTSATSTEFVVKVSCAKMPRSCWGRYVHVAVLEVPVGAKPAAIRATKACRIVSYWGNCNVGTTDRSASKQAIAAATALVASLNAKRAA